MPYRSLSELPDWVQRMPKHAQEIYRSAFNSALEQYDDEAMAARIAIDAVKKKYKKVKDEWVLKEGIMGEAIRLIEDFEYPLQEAVIDRDLNIIRNVCLLSSVSKNNRRYSREAMQGALVLFEGAKAFANHPKKSERGEVRDVRDLIGKFQSVRMDDGKVKGDLLVLQSQANWLFPLAEQMPDAVGLSLNGQGKVFKDKSGEEVVESIVKVGSVDLVTDPATTSSLFEQQNKDKEDEMDFEKLTLKELSEHRPDLVKVIEEGVRKEDKGMKETKELQGKVEKLEEEVKEKKLKLDEFEAKEKLAERREKIEQWLKESKLGKEAPEAITPLFRETLEAIDGDNMEKQVKKLIADRERVVFAESGKIKGMGDEKKEGGEKELSDERFVEAVTRGNQYSGQVI